MPRGCPRTDTSISSLCRRPSVPVASTSARPRGRPASIHRGFGRGGLHERPAGAREAGEVCRHGGCRGTLARLPGGCRGPGTCTSPRSCRRPGPRGTCRHHGDLYVGAEERPCAAPALIEPQGERLPGNLQEWPGTQGRADPGAQGPTARTGRTGAFSQWSCGTQQALGQRLGGQRRDLSWRGLSRGTSPARCDEQSQDFTNW
mmetsp:Transcript_83065/g.268737  ORF Transcript_83065/g.268737 Transcript_83065/m.268737 type:complete len:203 (+) Transcript_83065:266-874(+)